MLLIETLRNKKASSVPFWFMRQAGRYLPEYKAVRAHFPHFLSFCYTPEAASDVTLQPLARFDMSAAIIFSDILVIPDALGQEVAFKESVGPVLTPVATEKAFSVLSLARMEEHLAPVYEAIRITRKALPADKALIGFCGAPWTLACYMIQGKSSRDFADARGLACKEPELFTSMMRLLEEAVIQHACRQIEAGADVIQLFDSWSGVLSENEFHDYVVQPTQRIVQAIRKKHPSVPLIGFPRMCGAKLVDYANHTAVDAVSFDGSVSLDYMKKNISVVAQGNLDSLLLAEDGKQSAIQAKKILEHFKDKPFVFNLAHGILPHTPIENVQRVSDVIKAHL